jgi:hypothetical protein
MAEIWAESDTKFTLSKVQDFAYKLNTPDAKYDMLLYYDV